METSQTIEAIALRNYESVRRAQKAYWRRKNPNPNPRGRPKKVVETSVEVKSEVAQTPV